MTIRNTVLCDKCDAVFVPDNRLPHGQLIRLAHAAGWSSHIDDNGWQNTCPDHTETA